MTDDASQTPQPGQGDTAPAGGESGANTDQGDQKQTPGLLQREPQPGDGDGQQQSGQPQGDQGGGQEGNEGEGGEGGKPKLDLSALPEDLRAREELQGYESMDDLLADLKRGRGSREGVPEQPDGYEIHIPEGLQMDEGMSQSFRKAAHDAGLTQEQVDKIVGWHNAGQQRLAEQGQSLRQEGEAKLKDAWGDSYEENLALAQKGFEVFGSDELGELLSTTGFGNHPAVVQAFHNIGRAISEDSLVISDNAPKEVQRTAGGEPVFRRKAS